MNIIRTIKQYNISLISDDIDIDILDYVKEIMGQCKIDKITDEFMEWVGKDDFIIPHTMLQKYGILTIEDTTVVKRLMNRNNFEEGTDFIVEKIKHTTKNVNSYLLTPNCFKKCLIRSLKTSKYADYYIFLETCIKYYNEYQNKLMSKRLEENSSKIKKYKSKTESLIETVNLLNENVKIMRNENNKYHEDIKSYQKIIKETTEEIANRTESHEVVLNKIAKKLKIATRDREPPVSDDSLTCELVIFKNNDTENEPYEYSVIRAQKKYLNVKIKEYNILHKHAEKILKIHNVTNAITLWNRVKEQMKDKINYSNTNFNIRKQYDEAEILSEIKSIYKQKYEVDSEDNE